jgi:hypothetical protein
MARRLLRLASSDRPRDGEAGFALIEVIVSAAVLALVALAVLAGVDAAGRSTGREKARSVGVGLAEQDQERLRALPAVDVEAAGGTSTVSLNGATYTVSSTVEWVNDATGGTPSCDNDGKEASYLRITSRVTSPTLPAPVVLSSLVEPPISKSGAGQGTLAVQVNDRNGRGVPSVEVTTTNGPDPDKTATTNASGCAVFGKIGAGNYDLLLSKSGYVDDHGRGPGQGASGTATVSNQVASVVPLRYDLAAPWRFKFQTGNAISAITNDLIDSASESISASNAQVDDLLTWTVSPSALTMDVNLFPFTAAYSVFAGHCLQADPLTVVGDTYYSDNPTFGGQVAANPGVAGPTSPPTTIVQPPLRVRVVDGSGSPRTGTTTLVKVTSVACGDTWTLPVTNNTTTNTGYPTSDNRGWGYATFTVNPYQPGLPYGDYTVCAQARISSTTRHSAATPVTLNNPYAGTSTVTNIPVTSSSASGACP